MTDYEKLKQAQSDAFVESCDKIDVLQSPLAKEFFLAGWAAADAFADEQHQHVDNFDKFGKPEQLPTTPDREMMRFEAAKAALAGILSNASLYECQCRDAIHINSEPIAGMAVACADRLIIRLNNG